MKDRYISVTELLEKRFNIDPAREAQAYCDRWPGNLIIDGFPRGSSGFTVKRASKPRARAYLHEDINSFPVELSFSAPVAAHAPGGELTRVTRFYVRCFIDLERGRLIGRYISLTPPPDDGFSASGIPLDETFAPIMTDERYILAAEAIRREFAPAHGPFTPAVLARAMRLDVTEADFADPFTLGQLFLTGGETLLLDSQGRAVKRLFPAGTMLTSRARGGEKNATIAHECCHMYLHRPFFLLQALTGALNQAHALRVSGPTRLGNTSERLERQCETLPGHIFLNEEETREEMYAAMERHGDLPPLEMLRSALTSVAESHALPVSTVRRRLIAIGFTSLSGICLISGGERVPDHLTSSKWPKGVSFTISPYDAALLLSSCERLAKAAASGEYLYTERHFCLNDRRYIEYAPSGLPRLTQFARENINLCCVGFTLKKLRTLPRRLSLAGGVAARAKQQRVQGRYMTAYALFSEPGTERYASENAFFTEDSLLWGELEYSLPGDFRKALTLIIDKLNVSRNALAYELGVDKKVVYRLLRSSRASLRHTVGVCVALKLPYSVSIRLIHASGNALADGLEHHLYRAFLLRKGELTIDRCDGILAQNGLKRLFNSEM